MAIMAMNPTERVFVYGTLRRGAAQGWRMDGGLWIGTGVIRGRLYRIDWYPGLVLDREGGEVAGDVYEVALNQMNDLDDYEGDGYRRVRVRVEGDAPGEAWVWEWLGDVEPERLIPAGDWLRAEG